jgi:hypothetical protein
MYYLYKKTHKKTGLQYLGKTSKDPYEYKGSGLDWIEHLKEFGNEVDTEVLLETTDPVVLSITGRQYSDLWQVASSPDWANRVPEAGGGGWNIGKKYSKEESKKFGHTKRTGIKFTAEQRKTLSNNHADVTGKNNPMYGKKHKESTLLLMKQPKPRVTRLFDKKEMSVNHYTRWIKRNNHDYR